MWERIRLSRIGNRLRRSPLTMIPSSRSNQSRSGACSTVAYQSSTAVRSKPKSSSICNSQPWVRNFGSSLRVKVSQALSLTISNSSPALSGRALLCRVAILKPRIRSCSR
ncbi:hypothetical protein D9M71_454520 [compost metagenome]